MKLDNAATAKKLGKLRMPEKRKGMDLSELDESSDSVSEAGDEPAMDDAMAGDEDLEAMDMEASEGEGGPLSGMSDDELMAEVKKRGLMAELGKPEGEEEDELGLG